MCKKTIPCVTATRENSLHEGGINKEEDQYVSDEFRMTASDYLLESNNSDNMWSSSRTIDRNCGYASIHERLYMMSSDHILHGREKRLRIKKESMDRAAKRNGRTPIHKGYISASDAIRLGARLYEEGLLAKQKREQMRIRIFEQREAELEAVAFA